MAWLIIVMLVAGMAQFIWKSKLWQGGATSIISATVGHAVTSRHTFVIFLMWVTIMTHAMFDTQCFTPYAVHNPAASFM